jgi:hypothetical protein
MSVVSAAVQPPEPAFPFKWGQEVRFVGGKYNGFNGVMRWCGETSCEVRIRKDAEHFDVVEDTKFLSATKPE